MKKTLMIMLALVLVIAMSVSATLAYLTDDTEVVTNTFTVGNLEITLDEAKTDVYGVVTSGRGNGNEYKLIPGHKYVKDPTVHVQPDSEKSYLFVEVVNGLATYEAASETTTIAAQMKAKGWENLDGNVYYKIAEPVAKEATTAVDYVVFENFTLKDNADFSGVTNLASLNITIKAYAVQYDGFETDINGAWAAAQEAAEEQA